MAADQTILEALAKAVLEGDDNAARTLAEDALAAGIAPLAAIDKGLVPAIRRAGELWEEGEYFLPELVTAAQAMKAGMAVFQPLLTGIGTSRTAGRVVIGTVAGDIHDIGKTLVATMLEANGFEIADEGVGVSVQRFVARAHEIDADLVCASALLTTTMLQQRDLVAAVRGAGLKAKVMVGGAPVTEEWARGIGADGFADNAVAAVAVARRIMVRNDS
jgi:corrinoid protein of di/trimethylamine methyltransferase